MVIWRSIDRNFSNVMIGVECRWREGKKNESQSKENERNSIVKTKGFRVYRDDGYLRAAKSRGS